MRDYGVGPIIWDGDKDCNHEFNEYNSKLLHEDRQNLDGGTLGNHRILFDLYISLATSSEYLLLDPSYPLI